jgi:chromosome segregation ATPase
VPSIPPSKKDDKTRKEHNQMNQPTREELEEIKRRLARIERQTEPIQITRLEIDAGGIYRKLDEIEENTNATKIQMEGVRGDFLQIRESQADLRDRLIEHSEDLKVIQEKQETHTELLGKLIGVGEGHTKRFDQIDESIAELKSTQAELKSTQAELKSAQAEQGAKLDLILKLLQPGGEQQ